MERNAAKMQRITLANGEYRQHLTFDQNARLSQGRPVLKLSSINANDAYIDIRDDGRMLPVKGREEW